MPSFVILAFAINAWAQDSGNRNSLAINWDCPGAPRYAVAGDQTPYFRELNLPLIYARDGSVHADLSSVRQLASELRSSPAGLSYCAVTFGHFLSERIKEVCQQNSNIAPTSESSANRACARSGVTVLAASDRIFRDVIAADDGRTNKVTRIVIGEPIGSEAYSRFSQADREATITAMVRTCSGNPRPDHIQGTNYLGYVWSQEFMTEALPRVMTQASEACQAGILSHYLESWRGGLESEGPELLPCLENLSLPVCGRYRDALANLVRAMPRIQLGANVDQHISCLELVNPSMTNLRRVTEDLREVAQCVNLAVGESRVLDIDGIDSSTSVEQRYQLDRLSENQYRSTLNLDFSSSNPDSAQQMRSQVNSCLTEINRLLGLPRSRLGGVQQQTLSIVIAPEGVQVPPPVSIGLMRHQGRSSSRVWEPGISCAVIAHELMHLMGLVDEYQEAEIGFVHRRGSRGQEPQYRQVEHNAEILGYNCRSIGPEDSLMRDHNQGFDNARIQGVNLLYPAQLRSIISPGCRSLNGNYINCASSAYETALPGHECPTNSNSACNSQSQALVACLSQCRPQVQTAQTMDASSRNVGTETAAPKRRDEQYEHCIEACSSSEAAWLR